MTGPDDAMSPAERRETQIQRRQRLLGPAYRLFYEEPVEIVRGRGVWLYDEQGRPFLDAYNNVAVAGHCHPGVVEAIARQAVVLNTHTRYLHPGILDYAERLLGKFPAELGHLMLTCTGSEANDLALRVARAATGGTGVIVTEWAYHGTSEATAALSPSLGAGWRRPDHVRLIPPPDTYRGDDAGAAFAAAVRAAVEDLRGHGIRPAALLVDTIFSSDGVFAHPDGLLREAVDAIHAAGGLFIADEVQPGFGRTGEAWWGFQTHGVVPDMVTMGKPMGNGHPMAGMVVRPEIVEPFGRSTRYFNTFGGNPVACAAGMAVLEAIESEDLVGNAARVGRHLQTRLRALARDTPLIGDVRGRGLFIGVELVTDRAARTPATAATVAVVNGLRRRGVLIGASGPAGNILKIRPPLVFSQANADFLIERLRDTLAEL